LHTIGELCLSPIGLSMASKLAPMRFSSLLMATWYLGNAAANKFAGTLSSLIPPSSEDFAKGAKIPHILGFQINNLFDFFMIFIVMTGAASFVLFLVSGKLIKMMRGIR
ncbi:MAG TPA: MFS transporter, partial [Arachidicoccus sp.]